MKTLEILNGSESTLAPRLKHLKTKELERHAQKLLLRKGGADYKKVIGEVIRLVPALDGESSSKFEAVQGVVRSHFRQGQAVLTDDKDLIERITVIIMVIIAKKFNRIHGEAG